MITYELAPSNIFVKARKPGPPPDCPACMLDGEVVVPECALCGNTRKGKPQEISIGMSYQSLGKLMAQMTQEQLAMITEAYENEKARTTY